MQSERSKFETKISGLPFGTEKTTLSEILFKETGIVLKKEPYMANDARSIGPTKVITAYIHTSDEREHMKIVECFRYFELEGF